MALSMKDTSSFTKLVTSQEFTDIVLDNYAALHRPISVQEKGSAFMGGIHGIILRPHECYMDLIGPFNDVDDFWKICEERFKEEEFLVVPHLKDISPIKVTTDDEPFVWKGNYESFKDSWQLD
jgi:hypothetical protein